MLTPFQQRARRALGDCPLFGALTDERLRLIDRTPVRRGDLLFEQGDASDALHALVGGQAKRLATARDGKQISFGLVGPGELIGQIGVSTHAPRHASVVALAHCEFATLRRRHLEPLLAQQPELRDALSRASAEEALKLSERIADSAFLSIEDRVEKALLDFAQRFGERIEEGICVALRQQDLADVLGLSRESVSRVLTATPMKQRVRLGRGRIVLLER